MKKLFSISWRTLESSGLSARYGVPINPDNPDHFTGGILYDTNPWARQLPSLVDYFGPKVWLLMELLTICNYEVKATGFSASDEETY